MVDESSSSQDSAPKLLLTADDLTGMITEAVTLVLSRLDTRPADKALPDLRAGLLELDRLLEGWVNAAVTTNSTVEHFVDKPDQFLAAAGSQRWLSGQVYGWLGELGPEYTFDDNFYRSDVDTETLRRLFEIYAPEVRANILALSRSRFGLVQDLLVFYARTFDRYGGSIDKRNDFMNFLNKTLEDLREAQYRLRAYIRESFPLHP